MAATTGGIKAGRAFIVIDAVDKSAHILGKIGDNFKKWGRGIQQVGQKMLGAGLFGGAALGMGIRQFAEYDEVMKRVQAKSEGTVQAMTNLRNITDKLSLSTKFSATQVGRLMEELAQSSFSNRGDIATMTEDILNLARAGGTGDIEDTAKAAKLVAETLQAFNLKVKDTRRLTDLLASTVNVSQFGLENLTEALQYAAPAAAEFNTPIEDILASVSMLRNVGIAASTVGSALRNIQTEMSNKKHIEDFNAKFTELTGKVVEFGDKSGNLQNPVDLLHQLAKELKGVGNMDVSDLFHIMFGKRSQIPGQVLASRPEEFARIWEQIANPPRSAADTAKEMDTGNLATGLTQLWNVINNVGRAIGEALAPALLDFVAGVKESSIAVIAWIKDNKELVVLFAKIVVSLIVGGAAMMAFGMILKAAVIPLIILASGLKTIGGAFRFMFTPITKLLPVLKTFTKLLSQVYTGGLLKLARGFTLLSGFARSLSVTLQGLKFLLYQKLSSAFMAVASVAARIFGPIALGFRFIAQAAVTSFGRILFVAKNAFAGGLLRGLSLLPQLFGATLSIIAKQFSGLFPLLISLTKSSFGLLISTFTKGLMVLLAPLIAFSTKFVLFFTKPLALIGKLFFSGMGMVARGIFILIAPLGTLVASFAAFFGSAIYVALSLAAIVGVCYLLYKGIKLLISSTSSLATNLKTSLVNAWNTVLNSLKAIWEGIKGGWDEVLLFFSESWQHIKEGFSELAGTFKTTWGGVVEALSFGDLQGAWSIAMAGMSLAWTQFIDMMYDLWDGFNRTFVDSFIEAQRSITRSLLGMAKNPIVAKILGVDIAGEAAKWESSTKNSIKLLEDEIARLRGGGALRGDQSALGDTNSVIVELDTRLQEAKKRLNRGWDPIAEAMGGLGDDPNIVREQNRLSADKAREADKGSKKAALQQAIADMQTNQIVAMDEWGIDRTKKELGQLNVAQAEKLERNKIASAVAVKETTGMGVAPEAIRGVERGSFEAFDLIQKSRFDQATLEDQMLEVQKRIADNTDVMANGIPQVNVV